MEHLQVVFLALIVVIYPILFAVIYEMRLMRRRSRGLPLFPDKIRMLESCRYAYNQLFPEEYRRRPKCRSRAKGQARSVILRSIGNLVHNSQANWASRPAIHQLPI